MLAPKEAAGSPGSAPHILSALHGAVLRVDCIEVPTQMSSWLRKCLCWQGTYP